jgi:hypothetical protein
MGRRRASFVRATAAVSISQFANIPSAKSAAVANPHGFRVSEHEGHACARKGDRSQIVISILGDGVDHPRPFAFPRCRPPGKHWQRLVRQQFAIGILSSIRGVSGLCASDGGGE